VAGAFTKELPKLDLKFSPVYPDLLAKHWQAQEPLEELQFC